MTNYAKTNIGNEGRVELHETLSLTGAEISINTLPAGANVPFIHSHKTNEEVYGILSGGQAPGGHNVISGLFDGVKSLNPDGT